MKKSKLLGMILMMIFFSCFSLAGRAQRKADVPAHSSEQQQNGDRKAEIQKNNQEISRLKNEQIRLNSQYKSEIERVKNNPDFTIAKEDLQTIQNISARIEKMKERLSRCINRNNEKPFGKNVLEIQQRQITILRKINNAFQKIINILQR
ncbi:MAG: hypothetical protein ACI4CT_09040 [Lachnospiraceae bacterium]